MLLVIWHLFQLGFIFSFDNLQIRIFILIKEIEWMKYNLSIHWIVFICTQSRQYMHVLKVDSKFFVSMCDSVCLNAFIHFDIEQNERIFNRLALIAIFLQAYAQNWALWYSYRIWIIIVRMKNFQIFHAKGAFLRSM